MSAAASASGSTAPAVSALGREPLARHAQQIGGSRAAHALEVARLRAVVARQQLEAAELLREPRHALPREVLGGQKVGARLVELLGRDRLPAQHLHLAHGGRDRVRGARAVRLDADREQARIQRRETGRVEAIGELVALLHALRQPAALAAAEHEGQQVEQRRVRVRQLDAAPGELEARALEAPRQHEAAQAALRRFGAGARACARLGAAPAKASRSRASRSARSKSPAATTVS